MGKLNIAHHKSYHPYRRDNIERVRRDEEEARLKEAVQEGRMMLADSEARIDLLRQRAGLANQPTTKERDVDVDEKPEAGPSSFMSGGHINLFEDVERQTIPMHGRSTKNAPPETEKGIPLAPSQKDLKPWYSDRSNDKGKDRDEARETRELRRKSVNDPLTSINHQLSARFSGATSAAPSISRSRPSNFSKPPPPPPPSSEPRNAEAARLNRESAERQRALELIRRKKREMAGSETPSTVHGGMDGGYRDVFNKREVEEARKHRERRWDEHDWKDRRNGGDYRSRR